MLELTAIRLTQGKFTLQGGLELAQSVAGVFGPSGTGKSALLKAWWGTHRVPSFPALDQYRTISGKARLTDIFRGGVIDVTDSTYTIELTGTSDKLDGFINAVHGDNILEVVRSGVTGIARGQKSLHV